MTNPPFVAVPDIRRARTFYGAALGALVLDPNGHELEAARHAPGQFEDRLPSLT